MSDSFKDYSFELEKNKVPVAIILPSDQQGVVGSIVKLDGRSSIDPEGTGLTFTWSFSQIPIGSQVERFGFTNLEDDASIVTFAPDIIGVYKIQLIVSDGSLDSDPAIGSVDVRIILVPYHSGIVPDASFIWNYLSDFWKKVDGYKKFETFWSAAIQLVAAEMLKLYQYEYSKSIRDIQEVFQRRWLAYEPSLVLDPSKTKFILADDQAGDEAETFVIDTVSGLPVSPQPSFSGLVTIPISEGSFENGLASVPVAAGRVLQIGDRAYTMARSSRVPRSINYAEDGATISTTSSFFGSGFTADMVGATLRILSGGNPALAGNYIIDSFVSDAEITVEVVLPGGVTAWPTSSSGFKYTVIPAVGTYSGFFADLLEVPAGLDKQFWRFSATIVSDEHDFETKGVAPGDVIEVEIARTDVSLSGLIYVQVVSVDRNRLGFVANLEDLVDGTAGAWLTDDMRATLAADLQVRGLALGTDGKLVYTADSASIKTLVSSFNFRRSYFEKELTPDDVIDLGAFPVVIRPLQVVRNKNLPVDEKLVSVPVLQEYIKQPVVSKDGDTIVLLTEGGSAPASREPYVLVENLDYVVDDEISVSGTCTLLAGVDEITIPYGDLLDRSIREQDIITVTIQAVDYPFSIRRVLGAETLRVFPVPDTAASGVPFKITRRVPGRFIRFVKDAFTKKKPAPERLWSEVSYFDNNDLVEANFGVLVGVTQEDLARAGATIPYKSAVAGLMYAVVNGPTISNLTLSAQILLGLPFTQNAGIIREINPEFRKRDDGSPLYGRILIDAVDRKGKLIGLTNIYLYPQGRQIPDPATPGAWIPALPDFSGLAINPGTGAEFAVGDMVAQFVPLSKGVQVRDYIETPEWVSQLVAQNDLGAILQKYHSFQILMNSDLVTIADIDVVSGFEKKVKPHYTRLTSALLKSVEDFVEVEDFLSFGRAMQLFEVPGLGLPSALHIDDSDVDQALLELDGRYLTRYISGDDLVTTQGITQVSSAAAGFVSARALFGEAHDTPFLRSGDVLEIIEGSNAGLYSVLTVDSDTEVTLDFAGVFESAIEQRFIIYRPNQNPIWAGKVAITTGDGLISTQETVGTAGGIGAAGVAVGDILVFTDSVSLVSRQYTIVEVTPSDTTPFVRVIPDPVEASAMYDGWVVRDRLLPKGNPKAYDDSAPSFLADFAVGNSQVFLTASDRVGWLNLALLRPGDEVSDGVTVFTVLSADPATSSVQVYPQPFSTVSAVDVTVTLRPDRTTTILSTDFLDRIPADYLDLELVTSLTSGDGFVTGVGSPDVQSSAGTDLVDMGVVPGDYVHLLEGADSTRDVGFGAGIFPVTRVLSASLLRLAYNLTQTNIGTGVRYGIRRKKPNEG